MFGFLRCDVYQSKEKAHALLGHAPGLWICCNERLPRNLARDNAVAVLATVAAMYAARRCAKSGMDPTARMVIVWLTGHVLWGVYLAMRLPPDASAATPRD